jgi:hypothetical protein
VPSCRSNEQQDCTEHSESHFPCPLKVHDCASSSASYVSKAATLREDENIDEEVKNMPVIEQYHPAAGIEPRICQQADPSDKVNRHFAELILHDGPRRERFLCKAHAASALAQNHELLAKAVIELCVP